MFKTICITTASEKASLPKSILRQAYDLMETHEAQLTASTEQRRRSDAEFEAWRRDWFLGEVQKDQRYFLILDDLGLRAFVFYTPEARDKRISLCNLFIRPSAQGDGRTFKRLICFRPRKKGLAEISQPSAVSARPQAATGTRQMRFP